ncbi:MAG: winged helix-turn-helix domain-containing protein [Sagittula sp.]|uniref:winged helix-turn-helix domain-containing protein n=1 Tax=Sagittula sp. TaxID=2038081 RepID=UPI0040594DD9
MNPLKIPNRAARHLWLAAHGLDAPTAGRPDPAAMVRELGFVQLDSIQVVSRAHHHILWSRNRNYREPMLDRMMARREVFEHFTHDASVLPMEFLPMWQRQFRRKREMVRRSAWYGGFDPALLDEVKRRIADEGPLSTRHFDTKVEGKREMWVRPPHKKALDYLWYSGELATCHRDGFTKVYDLAERVFPEDLRRAEVSDREQLDWLCRAALERLGFATTGEVRKFWEAAEVAEVADWAERDAAWWVPVEVESADGTWTKALAAPDIEARLEAVRPPGGGLRILNPFDPAIRDRVRLKRLFGFDYTVEMFVPAAKRQWGYYVFPLLEGDRFVGRLEAKADRARGVLDVTRLWQEPGVRDSAARMARLEAELARLARFAGVAEVRLHWRQ